MEWTEEMFMSSAASTLYNFNHRRERINIQRKRKGLLWSTRNLSLSIFYSQAQAKLEASQPTLGLTSCLNPFTRVSRLKHSFRD